MPAPRRPADAPHDLPTAALRSSLLAWYDGARRALPWRALPGARPDPWRVLVSELMLQQTTVATVRGRFEPFMARFPDLPSLAAAPLDDVLHAWQGLGYYRRARSLHACAKAVVEHHGGVLPLRYDELLTLPGVGPYTATAVAAIAGGQAMVAVDANVERVLSRLLAIEAPLPGSRPQLRMAAERLAAADRPADFAQAMMELGALVCTPRRPGCIVCPWQPTCRAASRGDPETFPRKLARAARATRFATAFLLERADGAFLFRRRPPEGLLGGMIELPATPWLADPAAAVAARSAAPQPTTWVAVPGTVKHVFTHIELTVDLWRGRAASTSDGLWMPPARFNELALPTLTKKLLRHAGLRW
ncbi:MAG: A/G-specific adenine glycosylase [Geminicoccaceae bacterium]